MLAVVVHALGLVPHGLLGRLVLIGLKTASHPVRGVGPSLLGLLLARLRVVRSELLLGLCRCRIISEGIRSSEVHRKHRQGRHTGKEVLASGVRHFQGLV